MGSSSKCNDSDFNLSFKKTDVKEGFTFGSTLASSKCHANRKIYWKYSGEGITEDDFVDEELQGSFKLNDKGTYKHKYPIKRDGKLEGNETLKAEFFTDSKLKNKIAEESILLIDTSVSHDDIDQGDPNRPYKLIASRPHVKENVVIRTTISNGVPGTKVYFSVDGKGIDKDDLDLNYGRLKGEAVIQDKG